MNKYSIGEKAAKIIGWYDDKKQNNGKVVSENKKDNKEDVKKIKPFSGLNLNVKYGNIDDLIKVLKNHNFERSEKMYSFDDTVGYRVDLEGDFNKEAWQHPRELPKKLYSILIEFDNSRNFKTLTPKDIKSVVAIIANPYGGTYSKWRIGIKDKVEEIKDTNIIPLSVK